MAMFLLVMNEHRKTQRKNLWMRESRVEENGLVANMDIVLFGGLIEEDKESDSSAKKPVLV